MSERPTLDQVYLELCASLALRATCARRRVGCVITDDRDNVIATGYNGPPKGFQHCTDLTPCPGRHDPAGDTSRCEAVHSEINAFLRCANQRYARTLYISCAPCFQCAKAIANTSVKRVVVIGEYADARGRDVLGRAGIALEVVTYG